MGRPVGSFQGPRCPTGSCFGLVGVLCQKATGTGVEPCSFRFLRIEGLAAVPSEPLVYGVLGCRSLSFKLARPWTPSDACRKKRNSCLRPDPTNGRVWLVWLPKTGDFALAAWEAMFPVASIPFPIGRSCWLSARNLT